MYGILHTVLQAAQEANAWLPGTLTTGLLTLSFWIAKRTVDQLDKVTDKTTDHGERIAVAETKNDTLEARDP